MPCSRFPISPDPFAPPSRKNYSEFFWSKLSSHSPLGPFFNHWKCFRVPTHEVFKSKVLDSFFFLKNAGATRQPSYSTSTSLNKTLILWTGGYLPWSLSPAFLACQREKLQVLCLHSLHFCLQNLSAEFAKLVVCFVSSSPPTPPFFLAAPVNPTLTISQWAPRSEASFRQGKSGGEVPIKLVWLLEDGWLPQF